MNLDNVFLDPTEYAAISQPNWPSYQELISGKIISDVAVKKEIELYIQTRQKKYWTMRKGDIIADGNRAHQKQVFFDKKVKNNNRCRSPWQNLGINSYGDVFICSSPAWIPKFVGNILNATDIYQDILNSETAQKIRQEIISGRYYYCNHQLCEYFNNRISQRQYTPQPESVADLEELDFESTASTQVTQIPSEIVFDFDHTCNFVCPSCRTRVINNNKHSVIGSVNRNIAEKIKTMIVDQIDQQPVNIRWAGGEPFISSVYLDLMAYIIQSNKQNITHVIQTNGSYFKAKQELVESLLPHVTEMRVSFDAASQQTYNKTRVNGVWNTLIDNVKWLIEVQRATGYPKKITADFVVQLDNYHEIYEFYQLCTQLGISSINYQRMWDWGTWDKPTFDKNNVYTPDHVLYPKVAELLNKVKQSQNENTSR